MRDLLTNIKRAIEIINKTKKLTISLSDPTIEISDVKPLGISNAEWKENILEQISDLVFIADDLEITFDCSFNYSDLIIPEDNSDCYMDAMKRIIQEIYDRYKYAKSLDSVSLKSQLQSIYINPSVYNNGVLSTLSVSQSAFSNMNVAGDLDVNGEINADDIKVNGGQLSVSSELDDLKKQNQVLNAELGILKQILKDKGII